MYRPSSSLCPSPLTDQGRSFRIGFRLFLMVQFLSKKILPVSNHLYFNKILTFFLDGNIGRMDVMDRAIMVFEN